MRSTLVCLYWALLILPFQAVASSDTLSQQEFDEAIHVEQNTKHSDSETEATYGSEAIEEDEVTDPPRKISDERWSQVKQDKDFIYRYEQPEVKPETKAPKKSNTPFLVRIFSSGVFKFILSMLALGLVLYIIYKIVENSQFNYFKRQAIPVGLSNDSAKNTGSTDDLEALLQLALQKNDYRSAVNLMYRQTIHQLHERQLIDIEPDKSNWAYVQEYSKHRPDKEFAKLTRYFDYIWYGAFSVNEETFKQIHTSFARFNNALNG